MPRYTSKAYLGLPGQVKRYRPNTVSADDLLAIYLEQLVSEMDEKEFLTKRFFFFSFHFDSSSTAAGNPCQPVFNFLFSFLKWIQYFCEEDEMETW